MVTHVPGLCSAGAVTSPATPSTAAGPDTGQLASEAQLLLARLVGDPAAEFRDGQLEAVAELVESAHGCSWSSAPGGGKSAVYFVATALVRARGGGPTLIVSPLLALMRDQVDAARRAGLRAVTMNSANADEWAAVTAALADDTVDLLLVSPERLNNPRFRDGAAPPARRGHRAARRRRGALHQRLGARLPARLSPDPRPARRPRRRAGRSSPRPQPPTREWCRTSSSSSVPAVRRCAPSAAAWPGTACGSASSPSPPPTRASAGWRRASALRTPVGRCDIPEVLAKFPALAFGIGHDGLAESPWLVGRSVEDDPARSRGAGARCVDIVDKDEGNRGGLAEPAACQAEHEDCAIACELDVPGRAAVRDGEPDGLSEAQDLGDPACCGSGITVKQVGDCGRIAARWVVHPPPRVPY